MQIEQVICGNVRRIVLVVTSRSFMMYALFCTTKGVPTGPTSSTTILFLPTVLDDDDDDDDDDSL
jgi:hypothetical protein